MSRERKITGAMGEDLACGYLRKHGYRIIARNFRCRIGEADIIAVNGGELCFVEVKTRRSTEFGLPCQAVDSEKQRRLRSIAEYFVMCRPYLADLQPRMDVIEILMLGSGNYLNHIRGAF